MFEMESAGVGVECYFPSPPVEFWSALFYAFMVKFVIDGFTCGKACVDSIYVFFAYVDGFAFAYGGDFPSFRGWFGDFVIPKVDAPVNAGYVVEGDEGKPFLPFERGFGLPELSGEFKAPFG